MLRQDSILQRYSFVLILTYLGILLLNHHYNVHFQLQMKFTRTQHLLNYQLYIFTKIKIYILLLRNSFSFSLSFKFLPLGINPIIYIYYHLHF